MKLRAAKFMTLMSDGSTDVSVKGQLIVCIHFATKCVVRCFFLGLMHCEVPNTEGIYAVLREATKFLNIPNEDLLKKMVVITGDGESVNTGGEEWCHYALSKKSQPMHCYGSMHVTQGRGVFQKCNEGGTTF